MKAIHKWIPLSLIFLITISCREDDGQSLSNGTSDNDIITIQSTWFKVDYARPKTYLIREPRSQQGNVSYLLIGDEQALMIDTGSGENKAESGNKIKHIVDQLTSKPVSLLLSHFHFDHNQNIKEFDHVVFPQLESLEAQVSDDSIYYFSAEDLFIGSEPREVKVNKWLPLNTDIDLGNRVIQIINIPGHTDESVAVIDKTNKMAFLGDYLYNGALFAFDYADLTKYKKSIQYLIDNLTPDYQLFGAHGEPQIPFNKLETLQGLLSCITSNTCSSTSTTLWGKPADIYRYEGMSMVIFLNL
ncbi:MBL fold metallo-hydrolase [Fulvivirgaceae bacterium BMA10]|uniref:MBL fold metallo-hydrolase n=1 Tax=Splendidivirga corallicola TaxID=3051826 RepID=A0ABT8KRA8_9BACT|nr:MBL fold metallo-hydrolase [Fulvivirgaceae bacterium BMA10]